MPRLLGNTVAAGSSGVAADAISEVYTFTVDCKWLLTARWSMAY